MQGIGNEVAQNLETQREAGEAEKGKTIASGLKQRQRL